MKESTGKFLEKAARAIEAAERLLQGGDTEFAVGRAYYDLFYVAEALLGEEGQRFRKHGGVHGAFGRHFVKTGLLDAKYHRWLLAAFDDRIAGDYGAEADFTTDYVQQVIEQAREFLQEARHYLGAS